MGLLLGVKLADPKVAKSDLSAEKKAVTLESTVSMKADSTVV